MSKDLNEETTKVVDASSDGTQSTGIVVESSQDNAGNDDTHEVIINSSSDGNSQPQNDEAKPETTQRNIAAEEGKIAKIERENAEYKRKMRELEEQRGKDAEALKKAQSFEAVDEFYRKNPQVYESFRQEWQKSTGVDLGDYSTVYGTTQNNSSFNGMSVRTPEDIIATVKAEAQTAAREEFAAKALEQEAEEGFKEFVSKYPEMDPTKLSDEEKSEANVVYERTVKLAEVYKREYPEMKIGEALALAYQALPENRDKLVTNAKLEGERIGKAKAFAKSSGNSEGISGGSASTQSSRTVKMTGPQKARYDKLLRESPKIAQRYAENIAEDSN